MNVPVRQAGLVALLVVGAAYCWWVSGLPGFSREAGAAVGLPAALVIVVAARSGVRARHRTSAPVGRTGLVTWTVVIGATVAWELIQYRSAPRSAHPTISSFTDALLDPRPMRAAAFAAWLALGWVLTR